MGCYGTRKNGRAAAGQLGLLHPHRRSRVRAHGDGQECEAMLWGEARSYQALREAAL